MSGRVVALAAFFLLASSVLAQTDITVSPIFPTTVKIQTSTTVGPALGVTPASPARRRLGELIDTPAEEASLDDLTAQGRKLLQQACVEFYGSIKVIVPPEFAITVLASLCGTGNVTVDININVGRKMLQTPNPTPLVFYGLVKENAFSGQVSATYVFNEDSKAYLSTVTKSGTSFKFVKAYLILPQEQTATNTPPYTTSDTGFLSSDPLLHPTFARLQTQGKFTTVPNVALRFDYESLVPGYTPKFSLYVTDFVGSYPSGVPVANLVQTAGLYLGDHKVFQSANVK